MDFSLADRAYILHFDSGISGGLAFRLGNICVLYSPRSRRGHMFLSDIFAPAEESLGVFKYNSKSLNKPLTAVSPGVLAKYSEIIAALSRYALSAAPDWEIFFGGQGKYLALRSCDFDLGSLVAAGGKIYKGYDLRDRLAAICLGKIGEKLALGAVTNRYSLIARARAGFFEEFRRDFSLGPVDWTVIPLELLMAGKNIGACEYSCHSIDFMNLDICALHNPANRLGVDFQVRDSGFSPRGLFENLLRDWRKAPREFFIEAEGAFPAAPKNLDGFFAWYLGEYLQVGMPRFVGKHEASGKVPLESENYLCFDGALGEFFSARRKGLLYLGKKSEPFYVLAADKSELIVAMPVHSLDYM